MTQSIENLLMSSKSGLLSRREFITKASALGVSSASGIINVRRNSNCST